MTRPFEPADVIAAYERHGLKPIDGTFRVKRVDGKIGAIAGCCCALTAMMVGEPHDERLGIIDQAERRWPEFAAWGFVHGFDGCQKHPESARRSKREAYYEESYQLGLECRAAVGLPKRA